MELLQLRYFLRSAETENFSDTAAEYMVPPSAVSASVKKLESELGIKFFDRSANKIKLNNEGRKFAEAISQSIGIIDSEIARIKEEKSGISGDIYLLVRSERSLVTEKMTEFRARYESVNFHLIHNHTVTDYSDYDIVIDENSDNYMGFEKKILIEENIKIAASKINPLAKRVLRLQDLKNAPFIVMSRGSSLYKITENVCFKYGFKPNIVIESDDPYYIRRYIAEDFGIGMFPEKSWQSDCNAIEFLNIIDFNLTRTTCAYLNNIGASKAARAFFDYL